MALVARVDEAFLRSSDGPLPDPALFLVRVLLVVSLITFLTFVKLPAADPPRRAAGTATTPENIQASREAFGLDQPVWVQYAWSAQGLVPSPGMFLNEDVLLLLGLRPGE